MGKEPGSNPPPFIENYLVFIEQILSTPPPDRLSQQRIKKNYLHMKIATLNIGQDTIETRNSMWTGIETDYFNGQKVSSQFNWFVGIHHFEIPADDGYNPDYYRVEFRFDWSTGSVKTDIFRNEVCILDMSGKHYRYLAKQGSALPAVNDDHPVRGNWSEGREKVATPLYREDDLV
jgi:hypothetical protein